MSLAGLEATLADGSEFFAALWDHNTRLALVGAGVLGAAAGLVGTFLVLRRRALMADTLSHSTLPGVGIAFLALAVAGASPRSQFGLMAGGALAAFLAAWSVSALQRVPRVREDAALATVLGVLFGFGLVLMGVIQQLGTGQATGLDAFVEGSINSLTAADVGAMVALALVAVLVTVALFKVFTVIAFDPELARLQGLPVRRLETVQLLLVVLVTVAGLRAVGLILIIALLVIPPAAARRWSDRLPRVAAIAAGIGAFSGVAGALWSALADGLPTGPLIVLVAVLVFFVSLAFGPVRRTRAVAAVTAEVR